MDKKCIIKNHIDKLGRYAYITDDDWTSMPFKVCINHLWRRKSSLFEPEHTVLGKSQSKYYLYIGPYNHDITVLTDNAVLMIENEKFEFKCADAVYFDDEVIYYTGILRLIEGDEIIENQ